MIQYKRIFCIILFLSCLFLYAEEQSEEINIDKYRNIIYTMLHNFSAIIGTNKISTNVYETFTLSERAVRNNNVTFEIDPGLDRVLNGMVFRIYSSDKISLVFGVKYLDTYSQNSSIHYSILMHEYRHLHDYLKNKINFINAKKDEKESYWYELDALRIEAEFIKYYLLGKYNLTKFEKFLLYSFEDNNLNIASILLEKVSMNVFFYFNNLESKYIKNEISKEDVINELEQNASILIDNYYEASDEFNCFLRYIEINTFRKYLIRLLVIVTNNPQMTWGEVFIQYPVIESIYNNMSEILKDYSVNQSQYLDLLYQYWDDDIINKN